MVDVLVGCLLWEQGVSHLDFVSFWSGGIKSYFRCRLYPPFTCLPETNTHWAVRSTREVSAYIVVSFALLFLNLTRHLYLPSLFLSLSSSFVYVVYVCISLVDSVRLSKTYWVVPGGYPCWPSLGLIHSLTRVHHDNYSRQTCLHWLEKIALHRGQKGRYTLWRTVFYRTPETRNTHNCRLDWGTKYCSCR